MTERGTSPSKVGPKMDNFQEDFPLRKWGERWQVANVHKWIFRTWSPATTGAKVEKAVTPPSPLVGTSPNGTKKEKASHSSKTKKDTPVVEKGTGGGGSGGGGAASTKRAAAQEESGNASKPKKKKVEKGDKGEGGLKEISILSPGAEVDPLKLKTISNKKNIKEGKCERRKSLDFSNDASVANDVVAKVVPKEGKIKGKEMKVKKEREKDKEKDRDKEKEKEKEKERDREKEKERENEKEKEKEKEREKEKEKEKEREKVKKEKEEREKEKEKEKERKKEKEKEKEKEREKEREKEAEKEREGEKEKEKEKEKVREKEKRKGERKGTPTPEPKAEPEAKIQKFKIKRTSGDGWSTTAATTHSGTTINTGTVLTNSVTTTAKQNERVNRLFAEFAQDGSDSDDEGKKTPNNKSAASHNANSAIVAEESSGTPRAENTEIKKKKKSSTDSNSSSKSNSNSNAGKTTTTTGSGNGGSITSVAVELKDEPMQQEAVDVVSPVLSDCPDSDDSSDESVVKSKKSKSHKKHSSSKSLNIKKESPKQNHILSDESPTINNKQTIPEVPPPLIEAPIVASKTNPPSKSTLVEMYKQINKLEDIDSLQGIVDIVESSGSFVVSETTFDFDLCGLQVETLEAIQHFLDTACATN